MQYVQIASGCCFAADCIVAQLHLQTKLQRPLLQQYFIRKYDQWPLKLMLSELQAEIGADSCGLARSDGEWL